MAAFRQTLVRAITVSQLACSLVHSDPSIRAEVFVQFDIHITDKQYPDYFEHRISYIMTGHPDFHIRSLKYEFITRSRLLCTVTNYAVYISQRDDRDGSLAR